MPKIINNLKNVILDYARDIILNDGYENLTMRNVSEKSKIAVGTIYNYFPTKKDLVVQILEDYWYDYLKIVDAIDKNEPDLYLKLLEIYKNLETFVDTFKEVWVKDINYGYTEDTLMRKMNFLDTLNKKIEIILIKEQNNGTINLFLEPYTTSKFLILNFLMMAQIKHFEYNDFEKIIKKLFK